MLQHGLDGLATQGGQAFVFDTVNRTCFVEEVGNLGAQLHLGLVDGRASLFGQSQCFGFCQWHAFFIAQGEHQMPAFAKQRKTARLSKRIQYGVGAVFFLLVGFLDVLALHFEVLGGQAFGNFSEQCFGELSHVHAQLAAFACGNVHRVRMLWCVEVVQVAQVRWYSSGGRDAVHHLSKQG